MIKTKVYIAILWFLVIFAGANRAYTQEERKFQDKSLETYKSNPNYDYGLEPGPEPIPEQKNSENSSKSFNAGRIGKWIMYIIIGVAFVLIAGLLIRQYGQFKKPNKNLIHNKALEIEDIEDIQNLNFDQKIRKAEEKGDFRMAVRWQFLKALKRLDEKKLIDWQKNKTNRDYYYEIKNSRLKDQFDKITLVFEHVWYGDFPTDAKNYQRMQNYFQQFTKQLT